MASVGPAAGLGASTATAPAASCPVQGRWLATVSASFDALSAESLEKWTRRGAGRASSQFDRARATAWRREQSSERAISPLLLPAWLSGKPWASPSDRF